MRKFILLSALLLSFQCHVAGQGVKANTDPLKSKFVAGQSVKSTPDHLKSKFLATHPAHQRHQRDAEHYLKQPWRFYPAGLKE